MNSPVVSKRVEGLLKAELRAAQEVLALQQKDNYKFQDHVKILDGEIDALRLILEEKQRVINKQNDTLVAKDDRIRELEQQLYDNRIEKHALKTFEHQNMLLLEELKETKMKMEELEVEVRFLRDMKDERIEYDESKMKMVAEMDIMLYGHTYEYKLS
jgi:predicted RNase H-like nuclease (RuvC/YqgF family)